MLIPLCVSKDQAKLVHDAGAIWSTEHRTWTCTSADLRSERYGLLRRFVPRRFRPDIDGPVIGPRMVPQSLWGKNLRAVLTRPDWDLVKRAAYRRYGYRCCVCGGKGPEWPVEADEVWNYDDGRRHSTLQGVIALCPACHAIRHWGRTSIKGRNEEEAALQWMMELNGWTRRRARQLAEASLAEWSRRSRTVWTIDYDWVTRVHGISLPVDAENHAARANRRIVDMALEARGAQSDLFDPDHPHE